MNVLQWTPRLESLHRGEVDKGISIFRHQQEEILPHLLSGWVYQVIMRFCVKPTDAFYLLVVLPVDASEAHLLPFGLLPIGIKHGQQTEVAFLGSGK